MNDTLRPNTAEISFLNLSYNRFYDIYDMVMSDDFLSIEESHRYYLIKDAFSIYSELLNYEPINWVIQNLKQSRPPMEAEIGSELFKFIRNIISHFPYFDKWDDIWVNKSIINWNRKGQTIDKFLEKYKGHNIIKYRFWEENKRKMTYLSIRFPKKYDDNKIYLKDILTEKEGIKFSFILMKNILDTQIEEIKD